MNNIKLSHDTAQMNTNLYSLPLPKNIYSMDNKELFAELSRVDQLISKLQECCFKLAQSNSKSDIMLAAQIQTYCIKQESYRVRIQKQIITTRK